MELTPRDLALLTDALGQCSRALKSRPTDIVSEVIEFLEMPQGRYHIAVGLGLTADEITERLSATAGPSLY